MSMGPCAIYHSHSAKIAHRRSRFRRNSAGFVIERRQRGRRDKTRQAGRTDPLYNVRCCSRAAAVALVCAATGVVGRKEPMMLRVSLALAVRRLRVAARPAAAADAPKTPTFTKDVAPIFQQKCEACHRPDNMAPMSLMTYEEARPWAKSIAARVSARQMPPWH